MSEEDTDNIFYDLGKLETALAERDRLHDALTKINEVRNSIIGTHSLNWSEHVYPLVAALADAGFEGLGYPKARENYGTLIERAVKAEDALTAIWKIVHTPTKDTRHRSADDHFQADFDSVRKIIVGTGVAVGGSR